ncbi:DUF4124 domain-containing protein [Geomonas subterranea]|uniref:DUF4124 domain-containing protein n=1 Tax=Geomonas subterranea TaxID=2847989 RepID=A0ABX8LN65_9BACT|nr:DUF4124 domain-containing protein [Geomonas subterranea]QXE92382.1 DUF4124 domain-containing protein [Geomonas subterranea]QXM09519.1 DUF4124 domain-containing protein [Geomonas subterranea]
MKRLLVLLLLLYPLSAVAETYQWTDERGTVNFADELGQVPKKYRKKARRLGDEGAAPVVNEERGAEPAKAKPDEAQAGKKVYGGKDEAAWRREFLQAEFNLKNAESDLATLKGRLSDTSRMNRSDYLSIQNSIRYAEDRVQAQQKRLDQLRETADRLGVPQDFRK